MNGENPMQLNHQITKETTMSFGVTNCRDGVKLNMVILKMSRYRVMKSLAGMIYFIIIAIAFRQYSFLVSF